MPQQLLQLIYIQYTLQIHIYTQLLLVLVSLDYFPPELFQLKLHSSLNWVPSSIKLRVSSLPLYVYQTNYTTAVEINQCHRCTG